MPNLRPIRFFYRNKSDKYYNEIRYKFNGEMRPYLKSHGGEQGCVLNGRLPGLFFSTFVDIRTNMPHSHSYFGPIRLYIEAHLMFNPSYNLYFADFYCHDVKHHVTLVITTKTSPANYLCRQYLCQLDVHRNPYLCLRKFPDGSCAVLANMDIIVEILYTKVLILRRF